MSGDAPAAGRRHGLADRRIPARRGCTATGCAATASTGHYVPLGVRPEDFAAALRRAAEARVSRRQRHDSAQGAGAGAGRRGRANAPALIGAANTHHLRRRWRDPCRQHRRLRLSRQPAAGRAGLDRRRRPGAGARRRRAPRAAWSRRCSSDGAPEVRIANRTRERAPRRCATISARGSRSSTGARRTPPPRASRRSSTPRRSGMDGAAGLAAVASTPRRRGRWSPTSSIVRWSRRCCARAAARGLATVDGLGMLLHQAAPGFEAWFGVRPEVDAELRAAVLGRDDAAAVPARPHRLDRHGQVDHRGAVRRGRRAGLGRRRGGAPALRPGRRRGGGHRGRWRRRRSRDGAVDRDRLRAAVLADPGLLARVEARDPSAGRGRPRRVPRARTPTRRWSSSTFRCSTRPGADAWLDGVLVVSAPAETQRARVLARPGMTEAAFDAHPRAPDPRRREARAGRFRHRDRQGR